MKRTLPALALLAFFAAAAPAQAEIQRGDHRFGLTGGLMVLKNPDQTAFSVAAEYEYRLTPVVGLGLQASHLFAHIAVTMLSAPAVYVHPLAGDWFISAAPVFYFISGLDTRAGARLATRMPLDIDVLTLTPSFGVDFIEGGPNYFFGLGISI